MVCGCCICIVLASPSLRAVVVCRVLGTDCLPHRGVHDQSVSRLVLFLLGSCGQGSAARIVRVGGRETHSAVHRQRATYMYLLVHPYLSAAPPTDRYYCCCRAPVTELCPSFLTRERHFRSASTCRPQDSRHPPPFASASRVLGNV